MKPAAERGTGRLQRPGGAIAFDDVGEGAPVVCLPGLGDVRQLYRRVTPLLVAGGHRVVTVDLRGHGASDASFDDYGPVAVGQDVVALLEHLGLRDATVIGESFSAAAAVWAAAERPDRVARLVLVGPFVRDVPVSLGLRAMLWLLMRRPWGPAAWGRYYASLYPASKPPDLGAYIDSLVANLKEAGRFEALASMMKTPKGPCEARLGEVRARSLVVMGTRDPDFPDPRAEARLVAERIGGEVEMIEEAGHYPQAEQPERFVAALGRLEGR